MRTTESSWTSTPSSAPRERVFALTTASPLAHRTIASLARANVVVNQRIGTHSTLFAVARRRPPRPARVSTPFTSRDRQNVPRGRSRARLHRHGARRDDDHLSRRRRLHGVGVGVAVARRRRARVETSPRARGGPRRRARVSRARYRRRGTRGGDDRCAGVRVVLGTGERARNGARGGERGEFTRRRDDVSANHQTRAHGW